LRYDLTVPFARYVVQHQNDIEFPSKVSNSACLACRSTSKGRLESFQCDADVVGSKSLWQSRISTIIRYCFTALGLNGVTVKSIIEKILSGIAEVIGASDKLMILRLL
jgi:histidyl-tRNA synthetase